MSSSQNCGLLWKLLRKSGEPRHAQLSRRTLRDVRVTSAFTRYLFQNLFSIETKNIFSELSPVLPHGIRPRVLRGGQGN